MYRVVSLPLTVKSRRNWWLRALEPACLAPDNQEIALKRLKDTSTHPAHQEPTTFPIGPEELKRPLN